MNFAVVNALATTSVSPDLIQCVRLGAYTGIELEHPEHHMELMVLPHAPALSETYLARFTPDKNNYFIINLRDQD